MNKSSDTNQINKFLKILLVVIVFFGLIYLLTVKVVKDDKTTEETITYNEAIVGNSLTLSTDKYYVLFYDAKSDIAGYFDSWQDAYITAASTPKLYYVDLSKTINKKYVTTEDSNSNPTKGSEFKIKNGTMIIVENGKIINYIENLQEIYQLLN